MIGRLFNPWLAHVLLRTTVALLLAAHGAFRIHFALVDDFGEFLTEKGLPSGLVLAWTVTLYEIVAGALMAGGQLVGGRCVRWLAIGFIGHQIMGIALVHAKQGWFVVGPSAGGVEYSVLLIASLISVAADAKVQRFAAAA